jgi:hypothetical protein
MRRLVTLGLAIILLLVMGPGSTAWAKKPMSSDNSVNKTDTWADDSDVDTEVDSGKDDDTSDESTEPSKFKNDTDDIYLDTSADKKDTSSSKFKEDADDNDTEVDTSDEK